MNELDYSEAPRVAPISTQGKSIHVSGFIERKTVKFLLDTEAELTATGRGVLSTLPKALRTAFQDRSSTLKMANGESVIANGPVLCNISLLGKTVMEAVYVMSDTDEAILGMPVLTVHYIGWCGSREVSAESNCETIANAKSLSSYS